MIYRVTVHFMPERADEYLTKWGVGQFWTPINSQLKK